MTRRDKLRSWYVQPRVFQTDLPIFELSNGHINGSTNLCLNVMVPEASTAVSPLSVVLSNPDIPGSPEAALFPYAPAMTRDADPYTMSMQEIWAALPASSSCTIHSASTHRYRSS